MTPKELEERALGRLLKHLHRRKWHVALSLTKNCPLACRHCIVSATRGSYDRSPETVAMTEWVLNGLISSAERLSALTFTGGESPLADVAFQTLGEAARSRGVPCGLITSGYFAKSLEAANEFFRRYVFISSLTVSFDEFHEEFLPTSFGLNALRAAKANGVTVSARHSGEFNGAYYRKLQSLLFPEFGDILENQALVFGGRAEALVASGAESVVLSQCPSDGPHVSANGDILPCCSTIIHHDKNECLSLGNIDSVSFSAMLDRMDSYPLLKIIRVWGWDHVVDNVPELLEGKPLLKNLGGCGQCESITCNSSSAKLVNAWMQGSIGAQHSFISAEKFIEELRSVDTHSVCYDNLGTT